MTRDFDCANWPCNNKPEVFDLADLIGHDPLGHRVLNGLLREGITSVDQLARTPEAKFATFRQFGPKQRSRVWECLARVTGTLLVVAALCAALSACGHSESPSPSSTFSVPATRAPLPSPSPTPTRPSSPTPTSTHVEGDDGSLGGPTAHYSPN